jgi:hypothetical protein
MKILEAFNKKDTIKDKVVAAINKPKKEKLRKDFFQKIQHFLLYLSIFLAGFLIAKLQTLFTKL